MKRLGVSGGMVWSLELDDATGHCSQGQWTLLTRVHEMLNGKDRDYYEKMPHIDDYCSRMTRTTTKRPPIYKHPQVDHYSRH